MLQNLPGSPNLHIAIVGAGIGGLTCAIACRRMNNNLKVTVLERSAEVLPLGTGIHIPPNAARVLAHLGLLDRVKKEAAGYHMDRFTLHRVIHRGDYHTVLLSEAKELGAEVLTGAEAIGVEKSQQNREAVVLKDGRRIEADVVIGADVRNMANGAVSGLWSSLRETVLGRPFSPTETGDLAYRGTFPRDKLLALGNENLNKIIDQEDLHVWLGPGRHAVFYPLRDQTEYNLVLIVADDLANGVKMAPSSLEEMNAHFDGWDPMLRLTWPNHASLKDIISCQNTPLKWKLLHFESLDKWTKGPIALLGDATHPTLPYQGQGAAMAVEDAAVLSLLLARSLEKGLPAGPVEKREYLSGLLRLYQDLRKRRTETNVAGAVHTQHYYHLADGEEQRRRDAELAGLAGTGWQGTCSFNWGDAEYQRSLLGFDVIADSREKFEEWWVSYQKAGAMDGLF
ncbi:hypothetical protein PG991_005539 [Apiospora marii]|uniref:FAD-binding domain-containing protein n=1 Tax=Apiospora marii TaxID=335849 RepID=A0ABR1SAW9_9PEZI